MISRALTDDACTLPSAIVMASYECSEQAFVPSKLGEEPSKLGEEARLLAHESACTK